MKNAFKFFVVVSLLVITLNANAQIKVHPDSHVSVHYQIHGMSVYTYILQGGLFSTHNPPRHGT